MPVTTCSGNVSHRFLAAVLLLACAMPAMAAGESNEELQQEVRALRQRVEVLENRLQELLDAREQPAAAAAAAAAGSKSTSEESGRGSSGGQRRGVTR